MKSIALATIFAAFCQPSFACNYDLMTLTNWEIAPKSETQNILSTAFVYNGDRAIRMIDASANFSDVLGGRIASFELDRDLRIEPGEQFNQTGLWGMFTFERLLEMEKSDVETSVCVKGIVYADGTLESFEY
jgi:hypothetical protein